MPHRYRSSLFITLGLLAFFSIGQAQAQVSDSYFRRGYVVPLTGDTLRGEIDVSNSTRAALKCYFRATPTGAATTYAPEQLRAYGVFNGKFYQSHSVATDHTKALVTAPRFLEVLVQGPVTLYYLNDATVGDLYYARSAQGSVQPLWSWKEAVYDERGGKFVRENTEYRATLGGMMDGCAAVRSQVAAVAYQLRSLVNLVRDYNQCVGGAQTSTQALADRKSHLNLTAVVGGQASTLNFGGGALDGTTYQSKVDPALGLALEAHTPLFGSRLAIVLEALYARQHNEEDFARPNSSSYYDVRVDFKYLRVPILLRYSLTKGTVRPYLEGGLGTSFVLSGNQEYRFSRTASPNMQYTPWMPIFTTYSGSNDYRGLENSLLFGLGVASARPKARNLGLELRGELSNGFSKDVGISTTYMHYFLLLRYDLTK